MRITLDLRVILHIIPVIFSLLTMIYYFFYGRKSSLLYSFLWCQLLIFIWSFGQILEIAAINARDGVMRWECVAFQFSAICFIGLSWLVFALNFTRNSFIGRRRNLIILFIPPLILYFILLTNRYHWLFYREFSYNKVQYGMFFVIHSIYTYSCSIIGTVILLCYSFKKFGESRKQSLLFAAAALFPILFSLATIRDINKFCVDNTPLIFTISLILLSIATLRYRLLNIMPVAHRKIVECTEMAFIVIDNYNKVVDYNDNFISKIVCDLDIKRDDNIEEVIKNIKKSFIKCQNFFKIINDIDKILHIKDDKRLTFRGFKEKCFDVNVRCFYDKKNKTLGRIISFNDITKFESLTRELNEKRSELISINEKVMATNEQLKECASTVEDLAVNRERNRLIRDIHDTIGHSMILLINLMEKSKAAFESDFETVDKNLNEAINITRKGLTEVERTISDLLPEKFESERLLNELKELIEDYKCLGINIELNFVRNENDNYKNPLYSRELYKICQEALTNSVKHGKPDNIFIIFKIIDNSATLFIIDDGCGCKDINKGMGLSGMTSRVKRLGGVIEYGSSGETGFSIYVRIPLGG